MSAELTGFSEGEIWGTGQADAHLEELIAIVGQRLVARLLEAGWRARGEPSLLVATVMSDPDLRPLARNLACSGISGQWDQLPRDWRNRNGASPLDVDHVASPASYREGLVWTAIGAHPMGAKQLGFGSWAKPPGGHGDERLRRRHRGRRGRRGHARAT